jgi:hypothetical protein
MRMASVIPAPSPARRRRGVERVPVRRKGREEWREGGKVSKYASE